MEAANYLNYWHSEGMSEFKVMYSFLNTYSKVSFTNAIHLLAHEGGRNLEVLKRES